MARLEELIVRLSADVRGLEAGLRQARGDLKSFEDYTRSVGQAFGKALTFTAAGFGVYQLGQALKNAFQQGLQAVDDFNLTVIGVAATLTDMAADQTGVQDNYTQALAYSRDMYNELELAAARFFASGSELIQAWNIMAQKGVVLRKEEIDYLGVIVDRIKLATQGQVGSYQIAQELRAALSGQARATDQLAMILKDKLGPAWEEVMDKVRETGSLQPLAEHFRGLEAASGDIAQTMTSQSSTLWTLIKQVGREGLSGAYEDVVGWVQQLNDYLRENAGIIANDIKQAWADIKPLVQAILNIMSAMIQAAWGIAKALASVIGALSNLGESMKVQGALTGDFDTIAEGQRIKAEEKAQKQMQALADAWTWKESPTAPVTKRPASVAEKGGGGGGGGKQRTEDLLRYLTDYMEAKRKLEIKDAEESYRIFKAELDRKKAEMQLALTEGALTGIDYYKALHEMAQAETNASLQLIETKIAKEKEAYEWGKKEIEEKAKKGDISPEAQELALKKLAAEHALRLKELEGEALKEKIDLQKQNLELLRQEYDNRQRIIDTLASGREEAALGPIAEKEAEINRLLRERQKLKEEMIRLGATPVQVAEFDRITRELEINKRFGDQITAYTNLISGFFGEMIDAILDGEKDLRKSLNQFFKSLFKQALEPALKQMTQWLTDFFKQVFGSMGETIMSGIMGVIGLIGMLLTSGGGSSSWTPAGVQSQVTGHEAVRGIIAGETSIPIAQIGESLQDALVPTNSILRQIEANTRGGGLSLNLNIEGLKESIQEAMERYFREYLVMGASA